MSDKLVDMRHIEFLLYEVLDVESLCKYPYFEDHSRETFDMALGAASQLAREVFWPSFQDCDCEGAQFDGEKVTVPPSVHEIWRQCKEGGWFAPNVSYEHGGQQFPMSIFTMSSLLFTAGNNSADMYVGLTWGAAHLIEMFGSEALKERYMLPLYAGEWAGTMALTEPDAGSSVGDIKMTARPSSDGDYYLMNGVKQFISAGDHDLAPNIIHPVLARIEGAPAGVKGLSLFLIPKYRVNEDGSLGDFNDVVTAGLEHKMGLKASSTCTLNFGEQGDCRGWLIGEPDKGLKCMFKLMNHARIYTAVQAIAGASAAYQCALEYTRERLQGRDITNRDFTTPQIPIIEHPDVRSMLLRQKSFIQGMTGLILFCTRASDVMTHSECEEEQAQMRLLLEILTPCLKAYGSDEAFRSITTAVQCYGGSGFCEEYPVAQLLRDNKVFSIYEGANGIQAMDLLGRKIPMENGAAMKALMKEVGRTSKAAGEHEPLQDLAKKLKEAQDEVVAATLHLGALGMSGDFHLYICNATSYLEMFSQLAVSWQLVVQAITAQAALDSGAEDVDFYTSVIETARFYVNNQLPHALATAQILKSSERTALDFKEAWF